MEIKETINNIENLVKNSIQYSYSGRLDFKKDVYREISKLKIARFGNGLPSGYINEKLAELESACSNFFKKKSKFSRNDESNFVEILIVTQKLKSPLCFNIK